MDPRGADTGVGRCMDCLSLGRGRRRALERWARARSIWTTTVWIIVSPEYWTGLQNLQKRKLQIEVTATTFTKGDMVFGQWFVGNVGRSWQNSRPGLLFKTALTKFLGIFHLEFEMSLYTLHMKCVPGNNEELLYSQNLKFYRNFWRTRKKTRSAF
jgi:hypothetical protein